MGFFDTLMAPAEEGMSALDLWMKNNPGGLETLLGGGAAAIADPGTWQAQLGGFGASLGQSKILDEKRKADEAKQRALVGTSLNLVPDKQKIKPVGSQLDREDGLGSIWNNVMKEIV